MIILALLACCSVSGAEQWTFEQILNVKQISEVQLSPDNQQAVFVFHEPEKDQFLSKIYIAAFSENVQPRYLSEGFRPKWSPDKRWISFLNGKNLYLTNEIDEPFLLTNSATTESYRWSPDSKQILFLENKEQFNSLWLIDVTDLTLRKLTNSSYYVRNNEFDWSPDGKAVVFAYSPGPGCANYYKTSSLATVDLDS